MALDVNKIEGLLGDEASSLLNHKCKTVPKEQLHLPGPDFVDRIMSVTDRSSRVMRNMHWILNTGRLAGSGYVSFLPVDQGIEHSGGASFAPNPEYFDPEKIVELAIEGGCNGVASTLGVLGSISRKYAHKLPMILKFNHNEMLSFPNFYDQTLWASIDQAFDMGCAAVGATIYYGSPECRRQIEEVSDAFEYAHELGMVTILWCYLRNNAFKIDGTDYHTSSDLTGQANHMGATIEADIIKQKQATNNGGYPAVNKHEKFGKTNEKMYTELITDHPIDLVRYQVINCYMGRVGMINSGGASGGKDDLAQAVRTAVINKRAGGMGLISGRKAFQKPMKDGVELLNAIQDVYLAKEITVA
ncbi:MAG: class I fructose-bisphosphate aldolase [candidate division Zixibacteria bacterium]|nr:class I fructose-bisphosphate aldolase [candidate division Zixibacteria bacterium]